MQSVKVESSSVMTVEKFVDADSIAPVYYDAAYHLAPDGDAGRDVYAVLREAIAKTGKVALSRVVISQRERTVALRPADGGLMAHTLYEDRDLNSGQELYEGMDRIKIDPEMVQLATQLVQRQSGKYDASDLEDRYETRLRALIEAKLKGEGLDAAEEPQIATSNVVDLMASLKKSLGHQQPDEKTEKAPRKKAAAKRPAAAAQAASKPSRKTRLSRFFLPAMEADGASVLLKTYDAVDLGLGHGPHLVIAHAAFGALEPEHR